MRTLERLAPLRVLPKPLSTLGLLLLVGFAAYESAQLILADNLMVFGYIGVLAIAAVVVIAILNDWRRGVYIMIAWIFFEDFVRKYLGNNMAIYLAKDVLTLVLYLSFFRAQRSREGKTFRVPFKLPLLALVWFGLIQVFNPASTSIFYGILGMKIYFLYVPLMYVGYALIQSEEDLRRLLSFVTILILVVAGLGLAQSIIGPTFLNPAHPQEDIRALSTLYRTAPISGLTAYRPTSVFVSSGRFQDFLVISWIICLGYAGYLLLRMRRGRFLAFLTLGVVGAASVMSTSRGVFMWNSGSALIVVAAFLWGAPWRQGQALRIVRAVQRAALFVGVAIVLLLTIFPEEIGSRLAIYSETLSPDSSASELSNRISTYPLQQLGFAFDHPRWPYGYGIGTCTLGGQYIVRIMHAQPMAVGVESGFGNLIVELGIVGLVLWIILGFSISLSAWKAVRRLKGTPWLPVSFVIFLYSVLLFFPMTYTNSTTFQDYVISATFWLLTGILYRLQHFRDAYQLAMTSVTSKGV